MSHNENKTYLREQRDQLLSRTVLIVDDEAINREMLSMIVGQEFKTLTAGDGRQALEILQDRHNQISLVLLDLQMPVMDGYALLEVLHEDSVLRRVPVIVLTAEKSAEVKSRHLGAVDFIPKPYDMPDVILARIGRAIATFKASSGQREIPT